MNSREIFAKTIYGEARGEPVEGQVWVGWVIKNRARANKSYWGGRRIGDVCQHHLQFEPWNGRSDIAINEPGVYRRIQELANSIYDAPASEDPTGGCDHFHATYINPSWTKNCRRVRAIGDHIFYRSL